jgi:hypothetical protein
MKDVRFIWGLPQEDSFIKLKELITSSPVLVLPDDDLPFHLEADSSSIATGAVLSQQSCDDNAWHLVAFLLKALNLVKKNYEIHDTKMLAIIRGLEEWRHYLEGARHPVEIWTDHKILNIFALLRSSINAKPDGHCTCLDLTSHFTTSQVEVWANQMHSLGKLIMVQVMTIMTTSPYSPQNYFKSMHSQA